MAKKKAIAPKPVIKRSIGKDGRLRFFENGKPISNKKNEASLKFIRQDFRRLTASPTAQEQAKLTKFEKRALTNRQNALKGRDIISEKAKISSAKRYRIKGRLVSIDVQNTIKFNNKLKETFKNDTNLNNNELLKNVTTDKEALKIMSDMIDFQTTRKKTKKLTEVGIVALIENEDYKFRPEGTFSRPNEIIVMLDEINSYLDKTKPPAQLKVITQTGREFTGKEAYKELSEFMTRITDEMRNENSVAAMFFLPYKYVSPFFIVDLREFDENNQKNFITLDSELPQVKSAA